MNLAEIDEALRETEDYLTEQLAEVESMRSLLWARLPEARLSPEEIVIVAQGDS